MNAPSPDPLHGLDPADLMAAAAMPTDDGADTLPITPLDLPTLEEITAAFPDLEVLSLIGHGGMSAVFKARQPKLDRTVALKVLPQSLAATPGFAERFTREGRVLARLSHPSIVAVHDFGESGGFCYLLMEYVDGVNLRQAMRAGRFTPEQALSIIPAICDALQFAHTQGVLHRDIKPENILLDSRGKVKIADFGIAKILDEKGGDAMLLTQSGARLGTAPYMAPEQIEQPSSVDHRADIYSLGVVFYEMLTGELPLGRFAAPSTLSSVGGNIDEIVFRALEKERSRRQQSVDEFKTQVEGAGGGRPAPSPIVQHEKRLWLLALSMVLPCFVLFWVWQRWQQMVAEHSRFYLIEVPVAISLAGVAMYLVAVPLWLRMIGRNRLYGLRTRATLATDEYWFQANAHAGKKLFEWSISIIIAGLAGFYQLPRHQPSYPWAALALTITSAVVVLTSCWWWLRHHPVSGPARKESRLAKVGGKTVIAVIVALFIKSFILQPYLIPAGNEPGVAKGSHWIASKLDNGFSTGNLVVYEHDNGQPWIARVERREPDGLVLKRGGKPETFFVNWRKVIGKMLFSHFTPDAEPVAAIASLEKSPGIMPLNEKVSAKALQQKPVLRFTRIKINNTAWRWPVYAPDGVSVDDTVSQPLISHSEVTDKEAEDAEACWLQLWFEHPDFDPHSLMQVRIESLTGQSIIPVPQTQSMTHAPELWSDQPTSSLHSVTISLGRRDSLPREIRVTLEYTIGPWEEGNRVSADFSGFMSFRHGGELAGLGENNQGEAFLSWTKPVNEWQTQVLAHRKDGTWLSPNGSSSSTKENRSIANFTFKTGFDTVDGFRTRARKIQRITWDRVVLPPLSPDEKPFNPSNGASAQTSDSKDFQLITLPGPSGDGSYLALDQKPELVFTQIKLGQQTVPPLTIYKPDGSLHEEPLSPAIMKALIQHPFSFGGSAKDTCLFQLCFYHPEFDRNSGLQMQVTAADGTPLQFPPGHDADIMGPHFKFWEEVPYQSFAFSPGVRGKLPKSVRVTLRYCIGPAKERFTVRKDARVGLPLGAGCQLNDVGERDGKYAFISWSNQDDARRYFVAALSKKDTWIDPANEVYSSANVQASFHVRLKDIESFHCGYRTYQTVVFENVVIPPLLDEDEPSMVYLVSGAEKNGPLPYKDGMTIWRAIQWCGGVSVRGAQLHKTRLIRNGKTISLNLSEGSKDRDFKLEPDDQIIIPE
ncbi:MAG: protein kinase [Verrucomicrobiaceae bacterium]|nr:protein kinase [Verrucomicrobiaceae bacterium]